MVGLTAYRIPLPADLALTERSLKFYNGTYKWDSEGFTDDIGVYREFDCYDPAARAPTPLPPMSLSDDEAGGGAVGQQIGNEEFEARKIEEGYDICGIPDHLQTSGKPPVKGHTPPVSPYKLAVLSQSQKTTPIMTPKIAKSGLQDFASPSELSDCPSDLSEWDVGKPVLKSFIVDKEPEQGNIEETAQKPTTRGVAQKVKKSAKKPSTRMIKSSPAIDPVQTGSYIRGTGETSRRRSTRLSNPQGGK